MLLLAVGMYDFPSWIRELLPAWLPCSPEVNRLTDGLLESSIVLMKQVFSIYLGYYLVSVGLNSVQIRHWPTSFVEHDPGIES